MSKNKTDENLNLPGGKKGTLPSDSCSIYWDNATMCLRPYYQAVKLYRNGNFEWCSGEWHDLKMCLESKVASSPEEREKLLLKIRQREKEPLSSFVWEIKKDVKGWPEDPFNGGEADLKRKSV